MRLFSNYSVFRRISDIDAVAEGIAAAVGAGSVAVVVAIEPDSTALDNVEYVAAVAVVAAAAAVARIVDDVADNRPVAGRFSVHIEQLYDSAVMRIVAAAVAGMHKLMCSLRVKVAPNH